MLSMSRTYGKNQPYTHEDVYTAFLLYMEAWETREDPRDAADRLARTLGRSPGGAHMLLISAEGFLREMGFPADLMGSVLAVKTPSQREKWDIALNRYLNMHRRLAILNEARGA